MGNFKPTEYHGYFSVTHHRDTNLDDRFQNLFEMEEYEAMKYRDLQRLAKEFGVKANLPKTELINALLESKKEAKNIQEEEGVSGDILNTTFEISETEQNKLNETFEKEVLNITKDTPSGTLDLSKSKLKNLDDTYDKEVMDDTLEENANSSLETVDNSKNDSNFVVFMEAESVPAENSRRTRSLEKASSKTPSIVDNRRSTMSKTPVPSPHNYLTTKNKTPLRKTSKTPGQSIQKAKTLIPRFVDFARKRKAGVMPDFSKMHKTNFGKMESLDTVMDKKTKLMESAVKNKLLETEAKKKLTDTVIKQLDQAKALSRDHENIVKKIRKNITQGGTGKTTGSFVPAVTTTARMNLDFGKTAPATGVFKFSAAPAPAATRLLPKQRKDIKTATKDTKKSDNKIPIRERINAALNKATSRPLWNITNNDKSLNKTGSPARSFDIKASLSKPLKYQPHMGKLKSFEPKKEEDKEKVNTTKEQQMAVIKGVRMNRRAELMMQRRNIV